MSIQNIKLREPGRVHVFISHIWARDSSYLRLVDILHQLLGQSFINLSIPTKEALTLLSVGSGAMAEERLLQNRHLEYCQDQIELMKQQINKVQIELSNFEQRMSCLQRGIRATSEIPKVEARISNSRESGLGERLTRLEVAYLEELRGLAEGVPKLGNASEMESSIRLLKSELRDAEIELRSRTNEVDDRTSRISLIDCIVDPGNFNKYHHPDVLFRAFTNSQSTQRLHPNLALELYYRIRVADVIVVLASASDLYREWIKFENSLFTDLRKPLVVVQPIEDSPVPPELIYFSMAPMCRLRDHEIRQRLFQLLGEDVAESVLTTRNLKFQ